MTSKEITYDQLEAAIRIAFLNDRDIFKFYDKNVIVTNLDELSNDIMEKIKGYPEAKFMAIYEKDKLIGYFVYMDGTLISFGLNVEYRVRKSLRDFFKHIKKTIKGRFYCTLWSRNIRAVKYLMKQGMQIIDTNPHITKLVNP